MSTILELREKRAKAWDATKAFLDTKRADSGLLSAEDTATYDKMEADVVALGREVERLERQTALDLELAKPTTAPITGKPTTNTDADEKTGRAANGYKKAFWNSMRGRHSPDARNALQIGADSEGGYLVPDEFERRLVEALEEENVFRSLATVITTSGDRKIPVVTTKGTATYVDEEGSIPESDDAFGQVSLGAFKLATLMKVSSELLNDSAFNLESFIAKGFGSRIGSKEEESFLVGNGAGKPTGIFAAVGGAQLGVTTAAATAIALDELLDLFYSLRAPYRRKAVFVLHDTTVKAIRKVKDSNGQYIWAPSVKENTPDTLLGHQLITSSYVPTIEAGAKTIAFGDFSYYWIADREGRAFKRLDELYATTGQVGFLATQRGDGKLILPEAIKVLQQKA
ncbi:phage capsid protein [Clostridia bacterium]|nr:phage capsid protein [Clostridia bacterium]